MMMKKLLLSMLLLIISFVSNGQTAKPTKEQTIEYIVNTLKGYFSDYVREGGVAVSEEIIDLTFDNCSLTVKLNRDISDVNKYTLEYLINLKEIEQINLANEYKIFFLKFHAFNAKKLIKITANSVKKGIKSPETIMLESEISFSVPNDEKLVKAFNYLRKLCGAPEPIQF